MTVCENGRPATPRPAPTRIKLGAPIPIQEPTSTGDKCSARSASPTLTPWLEGLTRGYQNSADDNQIVNGLTSDEYAIGYLATPTTRRTPTNSRSWPSQQRHPRCPDAGNAVAPETSTVADGSYAPLSRYIYMNVNNNDIWFEASSTTDLERWHGPRRRCRLRALPDAMLTEMKARLG